jgi:hypothetical protein
MNHPAARKQGTTILRLISVKSDMSSGEERLWEILKGLKPEDVCIRTGAGFDDNTGCYIIKSFGWEISLSPGDKKISGDNPDSDTLLKRLGYFSSLSILSYLSTAKDVPLTGQLVNPVNLRGGQLFFRGTHILPLDKLSEKYNDTSEVFINKGIELGGKAQDHGDASIMLFPLPRVPVILILWQGDKEFPPDASILFDSTCEIHLPIDIIWSVAMMSLLIIM